MMKKLIFLAFLSTPLAADDDLVGTWEGEYNGEVVLTFREDASFSSVASAFGSSVTVEGSFAPEASRLNIRVSTIELSGAWAEMTDEDQLSVKAVWTFVLENLTYEFADEDILSLSFPDDEGVEIVEFSKASATGVESLSWGALKSP